MKVLKNERGDISIILLFMILIPVLMMLYALTTDEEIALQDFFRIKGSLNRATHAASLQIDDIQLSKGRYKIDPSLAQTEFYKYLKSNLLLDDYLKPLPNTFLKDQITVLEFIVVNDGPFPYNYVNTTYNMDIWLTRPGVISVIEVSYPRIYNILGPINWKIHASHELTY